MLKERYLNHILENYPTIRTVQYRTDKLKKKLERDFNDKLEFWSPNNKHASSLVYSSCIDKGAAIAFGITAVTNALRLYNAFKDEVRLGLYGKTGEQILIINFIFLFISKCKSKHYLVW